MYDAFEAGDKLLSPTDPRGGSKQFNSRDRSEQPFGHE